MAGELTIDVKPRHETGKNANRRLRAEGKVPAVVYGLQLPTVPIEVDRRTLVHLLREGSGENAIFLLQVADSDEKRHTMIRELQVDPIDRTILHVDFQRINLSEKVRVHVPIELVGTPEGVKTEDGILDFILRELEVECLPTDIPEHLELDVSHLHVGDTAEAGAVVLPPGVELLEEPDRVVVAVNIARVQEEEEEAEEDLLIEADQEEPEVIGKAGDDEEEAGSEGED